MSDPRTDRVSAAFADRTGAAPAGIWAAPGRVNLIGEHTDYNDGYVLPFALDQRVTLAATPRTDRSWSVTSVDRGETSEFGEPDLEPGMTGWEAYVAGVVWVLRQAGHDLVGADLVLGSDVPVGAGLSSSAALECATLAALAELSGLEIEPLDRARLARRAENEFVQAPTGLMDQATSTLAEAGRALFLDCRTAATRQVPLALGRAGLQILVIDTQTPHALVSGEYGDRRRSCEQAAGLLGVDALRDVEDLESALARLTDPILRRRVRHVVTENQRVLDAVDLLDRGELAAVGALLDASHASMRDDFEITVPTVDLAAEAARDAGAWGARMTGGGFGGCVLALVRAGQAPAVAVAVADHFAAAGFSLPHSFVAEPSAGARRLR